MSSRSEQDPGRIAVLLNANARKVSESVRARMARVAPSARIALTETREQARDFVRDALESGYERIVSGGGDGTLTSVASIVRNEVDAIRERMSDEDHHEEPVFPLPELGVLKLGTGNAVADVLSCGDPVRDMRALGGLPTVPLTRLDLLDIENQSAPFLGFGYDGHILNDYLAIKRSVSRPWLKAIVGGVTGYLAAAFLKTIPRLLFRIRRRRMVARIYNAGGKVFRVSYSHGVDEVDVGEGELFYSGPITLLSCGTVPYYGFKFTMFPFARVLPGFAHLRVARTGVWEAARNLSTIWKGTFSSPTIDEFLVQRVRIRFSEPMPFHISGDAAGYRREIVFGVHEEPFKVFDMAALQQAA